MREANEMRKMLRKCESLCLDLSRFLFKFMTDNVCLHKYVEPNKLSIFLANVRISANTCLYPAARKSQREKAAGAQ